MRRHIGKYEMGQKYIFDICKKKLRNKGYKYASVWIFLQVIKHRNVSKCIILYVFLWKNLRM